MILWLLVWLLLVSGLTGLFFLVQRFLLLKKTEDTFHSDEPSLNVFIKPSIDYSAFHLATWVRKILHQSLVVALEVTGRFLLIFKFVIIKVEKKFSRVINSVKGRGTFGDRGSVSLFLREIEEHKKTFAQK